MNEIIVKRNQTYTKGTTLTTSTKTNTPLFADDQAIRADSEDNCRDKYSHCET
jgi:hypothetical protein